jgi:hypothetical protein
VDFVVVDLNSVQSSKERRHLERAAERLGARVLYRDVREDDDRGRFTDRHSPSKLADVLREFGGPGPDTDTTSLREGDAGAAADTDR